MPTALWFSLAALIGGSPLSASSETTQSRSDVELLTVADRSFSSIPFGTKEPPVDLAILEEGDCRKWGDCLYIDTNHVRHCFCDAEGELAVKSIKVADVGDAVIAALGIGKARSQSQVLKRVRRFLPEAEIGCDNHEGTDALHSCGATLGEGWFRLWFDRSGRLVEVRLDAYHFT